MTGIREPQQGGSIAAMLSDSGLEAAAELRGALDQLRAVVPDQAPQPRADLAALLAAGAPAATGRAPRMPGRTPPSSALMTGGGAGSAASRSSAAP